MEMASTNPVVGKIDPNLLYLSLSLSILLYLCFFLVRPLVQHASQKTEDRERGSWRRCCWGKPGSDIVEVDCVVYDLGEASVSNLLILFCSEKLSEPRNWMKIFQKTKFLLFVRIANVKNSTSEKTRKLNRPKNRMAAPTLQLCWQSLCVHCMQIKPIHNNHAFEIPVAFYNFKYW